MRQVEQLVFDKEQGIFGLSDRLVEQLARTPRRAGGQGAGSQHAQARRAKAVFDFADQAERTRWYYTPNPRNGLPMNEMTRAQQRLTLQLVAIGLSRTGYATAATIMGLEAVLDAVEEWRHPAAVRDPARYYLTVFGQPGAMALWGWRFEGHHVSLHYTLAGNRIIAPTPTFFGSNPAEVPLSHSGVLRPLAGVEDAALELIHALTAEQRRIAVISPAAPPDIVMANRPMVVDGAAPIPAPLIQHQPLTEAAREQIRRQNEWLGYTAEHEEAVRYTVAPKGLPAAAMSEAQGEMLLSLIREYIHRLPDEVGEVESAQLQQDGLGGVHFAWAGGLERRTPHYYRLQNARFLVEYDKTQDDANHIHSVWRDARNDFGADALARHYALAHKH